MTLFQLSRYLLLITKKNLCNFLQRFNDTYISYHNACAKSIRKNLTCKVGENIVGISEISIDGDIEPVRNYACHANDLKTLICIFKQSSNVIPINYSLSYTVNNGKV